MSGGSMNYLYSRVQDAEFHADSLERRAFRKHLQLVAEALRAIEWVDSGDSGPGDDTAAILACLNDGAVLETAIETAHEAAKDLRRVLEEACSGRRRG